MAGNYSPTNFSFSTKPNMKPQPQQPPETLQQKYARAKWLTQFPALTVMVLLRKNIGFRLLHPLKLLAINGALAVIAILAQPGNEDARPLALILFAALSFCAGIGQRIRRWRELSQPARQHSEYIGTSCMNFEWLPDFIRRNRLVSRFIDPIVCALAGVALFPVSRALACYLVFAGFCLRAYEAHIFERERNRNLDLTDGLIRAEIQSEEIEQFEGAPASQSQPNRPGLSTGLAPDLQANIQRRDSNRT
jgi:hypothetical protein